MRELLSNYVKSGVKEALADHPVSAEFHEALNDEVAEPLNEAAERAKQTTGRLSNPETCSLQ